MKQFKFDKHLLARAKKVYHRHSGWLVEEDEGRIEGEEKLGIGYWTGPRHRFMPPTPRLGRKDQNKVASMSSVAVSSAVLGSTLATPLSRDTDYTILCPSKYFD